MENINVKEERKILKDRLQFVFVLSLFFPTMLQAIFQGRDVDAQKNIVIWGLVILCLILMYVIFEIASEKLPRWLVLFSSNALLVHVCFFMPVLYVLAAVQYKTQPLFYIVPFGLGLMGIMLLPLVLSTLLLAFFVLSQWKRDFIWITKKFK